MFIYLFNFTNEKLAVSDPCINYTHTHIILLIIIHRHVRNWALLIHTHATEGAVVKSRYK